MRRACSTRTRAAPGRRSGEGEDLGGTGVDPLRVVQGDEQSALPGELAQRSEEAEADRVGAGRLVPRVGAQQCDPERAPLRAGAG